MSKVQKLLGKRIAELRNNKGYSQAVLAERIGIATSTLANIEIGKRYPTGNTLDKIKEILEVEYRDLFDFDDIVDIDKSYDEIMTTVDYLYKHCPKYIPVLKVFTRFLKK